VVFQRVAAGYALLLDILDLVNFDGDAVLLLGLALAQLLGREALPDKVSGAGEEGISEGRRR